MNELRPVTFEDIPGQEHAKMQLIEACQAAKMGKSLDHICIVGPRGLGKTSMAMVIANELGGKLIAKDASDVKSKADFVNIVLGMEPKDVLLIDEIHGLKREVEESMYRILDDKVVDVKLKNGEFITIPVPMLSIIGASTLPSEISEPLQTRFGLWIELEYYTPEQLATIATNNANRSGYNLDEEAALELGKRARGTARIVNNLLSRVIDSCVLAGLTNIDKDMVVAKMEMLQIDEYGLSIKDRKLLQAMFDSNEPMGIQALAATIGEDVKNVQGNIEPFLMHMKIIKRTPKGRVLTEFGKEMLLCPQSL